METAIGIRDVVNGEALFGMVRLYTGSNEDVKM
jgi:hypothetical protein